MENNALHLNVTRAPTTPRIAIIAHDGKKADLVAFATFNRDRLKECRILATSTTGRLLAEKVGLEVEPFETGPLGGDVQIASRVVEGEVDAVIFIVDPWTSIRMTPISRPCCASAMSGTSRWPPISRRRTS
jgi:methylglyoxal synthase